MIQNISLRLVLLSCAIFLCFLYVSSSAAEPIYSIQTGSFAKFENATKQFDSLKEKLNDTELDYLRIEEISGHFKVLLGNFKNISSANEVLQDVKSFFQEAFILSVVLNDDNIADLYQGASSSAGNTGNEKPVVMAEIMDTERLEEAIADNSSADRSDIKSTIDQLVTEERYDEAIEAYKEAIEGSADDREKALLHKGLGDMYVAKDDYRDAAEEFVQALSLSPEFSDEERLQMAIYMSWGERLDEAIAEFRSVLDENPENLKAWKNLAKVLTWSERYDEAIAAYREAIGLTGDDREKAVLHKELGDLFVSREEYKSVAEEFVQALSLSPEFSEEERLQMAIYMSWGNRLDEAIAELRSILAENPKNQKARVNLAKLLSWEGKLDEAIKEADIVLKESPDNREALIVKSNSLRWQGQNRKAIPLYKNALEHEEEFDARLGLAYSYLYLGNITATRRSWRLLKPEYAYQKKQFQEFHDSLDRILRPHFDLDYNYYRDEDDNIRQRYLVGFGFWLGNWNNSILYEHTDAKDPIRRAQVEDVSFVTYSKLTESFGVGGSVGLSQAHNDEKDYYVNGSLKADMAIFNGIIGGSIATGLYDETAQIIENGIRLTNYNIYISQEITDKFTIYGGYTYNDYSDDNYSHDMQIVPSYLIYSGNPSITLRYRLRYLNFAHHTDSGYFNPEDFFSHQLYASVFYAKNKFYMYLDPYIGQQSFTLFGDRSDDFLAGGYGSIGYEVTKDISFEVYGEGGNYALGTAGGWNYYNVGLKLIISL